MSDTTLTILCGFCNALWTAKMIQEYHYDAGNCDTCDYGSGVYGKVEIVCDNCKRVVYIKEFDERQ